MGQARQRPSFAIDPILALNGWRQLFHQKVEVLRCAWHEEVGASPGGSPNANQYSLGTPALHDLFERIKARAIGPSVRSNSFGRIDHRQNGRAGGVRLRQENLDGVRVAIGNRLDGGVDHLA